MNRTQKNVPWMPEFFAMLQEHATQKLRYGIHDCATVAMKVKRMSGIEIAPWWHSFSEAKRALAKESLLEQTVKVLGPPIDPGLCVISDIGLARYENEHALWRETLCIHDGQGFIAPTFRGFRRIDFGRMIAGWRT